jgi:hypothetical protein
MRYIRTPIIIISRSFQWEQLCTVHNEKKLLRIWAVKRHLEVFQSIKTTEKVNGNMMVWLKYNPKKLATLFIFKLIVFDVDY